MNWHNFASRIIQFFWLWKPYSFETVQFPLKITILRLNIRRKYHLRNNPTKIPLKLAFFHIIPTSLVLANRLLLAKTCFFSSFCCILIKIVRRKKALTALVVFFRLNLFQALCPAFFGGLENAKKWTKCSPSFFQEPPCFQKWNINWCSKAELWAKFDKL